MKSVFHLLPLLFIYTIIIFAFGSTDNLLEDDGGRYVQYAYNLLKGFYTDFENPNIANGPGYPIVLAIFLGLKLPLLLVILTNGIFIFLGLVFFYRLLINLIDSKSALITTYLLGLYYPMFRYMLLISTEPITFLLICSLLFYGFDFLNSNSPSLAKKVILSCIISMLILTKVIFAYVALVGILLFALYAIVFKTKAGIKFSLMLFAGLVLTTPYLFYTYSLTGKLFYFSTASGLGLYWMTTNHESEKGSCLSYTNHTLYEIPEIHQEHKDLFNSIQGLSIMDKNEFLTEKAKQNIQENPKVYIVNIANNVSRILFNFPFSFRNQTLKTHWFLLVHFVLLIGLVFSFYPAWLNRSSFSDELIIFGLFFLVYFGGSCLVISLARMFFPIVPFIYLWLAYTLSQFVRISFLRSDDKSASKQHF